MKPRVEPSQRHEFTEAEWKTVCAEAGSFDGIAVIEHGHNAGDVWFTGYGAAPFDIAQPVRRMATDADVRAHLESRLWYARDRYEGKRHVELQLEGAKRARAIADRADEMIGLLIDHRRARPVLGPRDQSDPVCDIDFIDPDLRIALPKLQIDLTSARDFYRDLASRYDETATLMQLNARPVDVLRDIYWGELVDFWTQILRRPPTSSPTGPLTRFIRAASAPMAGLLRPGESTIHRFAHERLRLMQTAEA